MKVATISTLLLTPAEGAEAAAACAAAEEPVGEGGMGDDTLESRDDLKFSPGLLPPALVPGEN